MTQAYDPANIFARILRGEIPNRTVIETPHSLAFHDIQPQAPVHVLVIPKGAYVTFDQFTATASEAEIADFFRTVGRVAEITGGAAAAGGTGYRVLSNAGADALQEVPHFHVHVLSGRPLGRMIAPAG